MTALNYVVYQNVLYGKGLDGRSRQGVCVAHQVRIKNEMVDRTTWLLLKAYFNDFITYAKRFKAYKKHGLIQHMPTMDLNLVIKPWPFRGCVMDIAMKVFPSSTNQHGFVIVQGTTSQVG